jgi:hypothetical protein
LDPFIVVSPIVPGDARSQFQAAADPISMTLLQAGSFSSGNAVLSYRPAAQ